MRCKLGHQLIALVALLTPSALLAQSADSPIKHSLYVALGGDPALRDRYESSPLVLSTGVERARVGSRWSLRLGADYRRQSTANSDTRWEDFGVGLSARYGRPSGIIRPYLLGGFGIADLRTRGRWTKYDSVNGVIYGQADSAFTSSSRWNGSMTSGLGSEVMLGRLRWFTEARLNLYPARLSGAPRSSGVRATKALYVGMKF